MSDQMEALNNELAFQKQVNPKGTGTVLDAAPDIVALAVPE